MEHAASPRFEVNERSAGANDSLHTVLGIRNLTSATYVLSCARNGLDFVPGQHVHVGLEDSLDLREYSVYSGYFEDRIDVLIKEVENGYVSKQLRRVSPGDRVRVDGSYGFFVFDEKDDRLQRRLRMPAAGETTDVSHGRHVSVTPGPNLNTPAKGPGEQPYLFVATGTGIAPFHCFARSYGDFDYTVLHGIRYENHRYDYETVDSSKITACVTRGGIDPEDTGDRDAGADDRACANRWYHGRVTDYVREHPMDPDTLCYLCGNCDMIYECFDILKAQGVPPRHLFAEVYF